MKPRWGTGASPSQKNRSINVEQKTRQATQNRKNEEPMGKETQQTKQSQFKQQKDVTKKHSVRIIQTTSPYRNNWSSRDIEYPSRQWWCATFRCITQKQLQTGQVLKFDIRNPDPGRHMWNRRQEDKENLTQECIIETTDQIRAKETRATEHNGRKRTLEPETQNKKQRQ